MPQLVLLVVAAAWVAVLIPPMLRSRVDNRPNSSVTDFRRQLSTLQSTSTPRMRTHRSSVGAVAAPAPSCGRPTRPPASSPGSTPRCHHDSCSLPARVRPSGPGSPPSAATVARNRRTRQTHMERPHEPVRSSRCPFRCAAPSQQRAVPVRRDHGMHAVPGVDHVVDRADVRVRAVVPRPVRLRVPPRPTAPARSVRLGRRLARTVADRSVDLAAPTRNVGRYTPRSLWGYSSVGRARRSQ